MALRGGCDIRINVVLREVVLEQLLFLKICLKILIILMKHDTIQMFANIRE